MSNLLLMRPLRAEGAPFLLTWGGGDDEAFLRSWYGLSA